MLHFSGGNPHFNKLQTRVDGYAPGADASVLLQNLNW